MWNKLISYRFVSSKIYKNIIMLSIFQENNLVDSKKDILLKSKNYLV